MPQPMPEFFPKISHKIPVAIKIFLIFFFFTVLPEFFIMATLLYSFQQKLASALATTNVSILHALSGQLLAETVIFSFFLAIISVAGMLIAIRLVVFPTQQLQEIVQKLAKNKLSIPIEPSTNDEFGEIMALLKYLVAHLVESQKRERAISRAKTEFISIAAHQLRTPLSSTKWVIRLLLDGDIGPITQEQRVILQKGYVANENMISLIRDLLDVSRIEEGRFGYSFVFADIKTLVTTIMSEMRPAAEARNLQLLFEAPKELPRLLIDPQRMALSIQNVIGNAINYTPPKGMILVRIEPEKNWVKISVKDSGIGIPRADLDHLFTKFFRGSKVLRMQTEGSGLGLFIVRNIILRHGGDIVVESQEGKGSTFTIILPINPEQIPHQEQPFTEEDVL